MPPMTNAAATRPVVRPHQAMSTHATDQIAAAVASSRVRERPGTKRRVTSWPRTMAAVFAAYAHPR